LDGQEDQRYSEILREEGYELKRSAPQYRTILMNLDAPLDQLERGFHQKWRKHLNRARNNNLEIIEGQEDGFFQALGAIYREMLERKRFSGHADIDLYRKTQQSLDAEDKMTVVLCRLQGEVVAGALFSALGDTAVDLFRATSDRGVKTYGSYLVQWRVLEHLKQRGCRCYNLNGINPARNPGGYQFKSQLAGKNGREVDFLGPFDTYPNAAMRLAAAAVDRLRARLMRRHESQRPALNPSQLDACPYNKVPRQPAQTMTMAPAVSYGSQRDGCAE
jgi:lipid II:glycine glycyltransferase (peptidoglycan interpeptide bridge formation enzyme)